MPKTKKDVSTSDSDSGPEDRHPPAKKSKETSDKNSKSSKDDGADTTYWVLEKQRQVRINEFKGRKYVDIREFYEKNGESLPGKKGISLTLQQWKKLLEVADEVTRAVERD
ncbi:RNA polymerase II transcriptional coactivator [Lucilia cuprina]|uniref:RNA polymerase II transcriptional coactivator n=1 Tax=Lucilia cuprina TaxID=7375 RepID=A0A0L0C5L1_LUCCU|nr:RNA polymerase II transcriptional coactivator [Lucilia cuprina]KNC27683.1 RNA polymerase II transcriptional coactivator [Lucilia cuprina]